MKQIWSESGSVEASDEASNIGPLKKLSELFNVEMDKVVKFFIIIIILVFDPLGILLVIQFNKMLIPEDNRIKKEKTLDSGIDIENKKNPTKPIVKKVVDKNPEDDNVIVSSVAPNDDDEVIEENVEVPNDEIKKNRVDEIDPIVNVSKGATEVVETQAITKSTAHKGNRVN